MREPCHFCGDADAGGQSVEDLVADARCAANAVKEFRLEQARDAEGGASERYA